MKQAEFIAQHQSPQLVNPQGVSISLDFSWLNWLARLAETLGGHADWNRKV